MDSYRASLVQHERSQSDALEADDAAGKDDIAHEPPPASIGQDERRMQVRAYNHWTSLLGDRDFPRIEDLISSDMPDFARNAVVLDFSSKTDNPGVVMMGERLAEECGNAKAIHRLSDVPERSLLSRITDRCMQILASKAPIGFEAEFVNLHEKTVVYRGMLLPFSGDGTKIRHVMGVINWKELADPAMTAGLIRELDDAADARHWPANPPLGEWADGPAAECAINDGWLVEGHSPEFELPERADYLADALKGLSGIVSQERNLCRAETDPHDVPQVICEHLAGELRARPTTAWEDVALGDTEFAVILVRRMPDGELRLISGLGQDRDLIERAAQEQVLFSGTVPEAGHNDAS